jgi:hypothetical protein
MSAPSGQDQFDSQDLKGEPDPEGAEASFELYGPPLTHHMGTTAADGTAKTLEGRIRWFASRPISRASQKLSASSGQLQDRAARGPSAGASGLRSP